MRRSGMLKNAMILFAAMAVTKAIGALFKIPLTNILGGLGMGYFSAAYSVFGPFYALTGAALPTVITRLVAGNTASRRFANARKIRRVAVFAAIALGLAGTLAVALTALPFSKYIANSPKSLYAILAIAPALFFCCLAAVYRGYYEGLSNMTPTALASVVEAVVKALAGIIFAYVILLKGYGVDKAAAGAVAGITLSELCGLVFFIIRSRFSDGISRAELLNSPPARDSRDIIKTLFTDALPITLGALAMNLNPFIDLLTVSNCVNLAVAENKAYFLQNFIYNGGSGHIKDLGDFFYGSYTGITLSMFALIPAMSAMVSKSALPDITAAWEGKDDGALIRKLKILFKGTFAVGFPLCFGLAAVSEPLLSLLYFSKPAEVVVSITPLLVLSLGGIALLLAGTLFSVFLAIGRADLQIKLMLIGAPVKLAGNLLLIRTPAVNITGAAVSTVLCYVVVSVIGLIMLKREIGTRTKAKIGVTGVFLKPLAWSGICAVSAYCSYHYLFINAFGATRLLISVGVGGAIYAFLTFLSDKKQINRYLFGKIAKN